MGKTKITDSEIRKLRIGSTLRDTEINGLQARKRAKKISFRVEYHSPVTGKRRYLTLGAYGAITLTQARDAAKKALGKVSQGIDPQEEKSNLRKRANSEKERTLEHWLENGYKERVPDARYTEIKRILNKHFQSWLPRPMDSLTRNEAETWLRDYVGGPSGANRRMNDLRGVITHAVKAGVLSTHPLTNTEKLKTDNNQPRKPLTKAEEKRLLEAIERREERRREERLRYIEWQKERGHETLEPHGALTDHIKPIILTVLNTGLRQGEVFNLYAEDIDFEAAIPVITVIGLDPESGRRNKAGTTRHIPINKTLAPILEAWLRQTKPKKFLFPSPKTGGRLDNIKKSLEGLMSEARIKGKKLHAMRHTFGTKLVNKDADLITLQELMGHADINTTRKYLHTNNKRKSAAVQLLDDS